MPSPNAVKLPQRFLKTPDWNLPRSPPFARGTNKGAAASARWSTASNIASAARNSELIVVSHAAALTAALAGHPDCKLFVLEKQLGETLVRDEDSPRWAWPTR